MKNKIIYKYIVSGIGVFIALGFIYVYLQMMVPLAQIDNPLEIEIKKGMSFKQAVNELSKYRLINDPNVFIALGRLTGLHKRLTPGYYSFLGTLSPWDVFKALKNALIVQWEITVVEGDTLEDIKAKLAKKGIMSEEDFMRLSTDKSFLASLNIDAPSLEGYLFPDTYRIPKGATPEDVLSMMVHRLRQKFTVEMLERMQELGLDERSVLTLASIIEKEAVIDRERPIISAVYHNRLKRGMPLQADPTAVYGIKPLSAGVTKKDIKRKTAYNTYFIKGLPPGPIASAGIKSIKAALYPSDVPYLYFVSRNDGTHAFSVTFKEHLRAIRTYKATKAAARARIKG
jgi:UPF0755 protein